MLKKIENDIVFYAGTVSFRIYDSLWRKYILPAYTKIKEKRRDPVDAVLPYNDPDYRLRYINLRQQATYYQAEQNTFIQIPIFELGTFLDKEYFNNIVLAAPMLIFSVIDYYDDGRVIHTQEDIDNIVNKFGLVNTLTPLTDENAYQLNTCFDIMKKVDTILQKYINSFLLDATYFCSDHFRDNFITKEYYYQDCSSMNRQYGYDIYGLYTPIMDGTKKRLLLETIILIDQRSDTKTYVFQNTYEHWYIVRNTYINWTRSMGSMYEHQLGSNVYVQSTLYHLRQTMAPNHPLVIMMTPFLEGVYYTNGVFTDFGISISNTEDKHVNRYMAHVELFDVSNETMRESLRLIHEEDGYKILNYEIALKENEIDDIYFEQKESLQQLYDMIKELVTSVITYYYNGNLQRDPELKALFVSMSKDFPFLNDFTTGVNAILFFTNIIYLSSVRHSQSHINFAYLNNYYDYALRKTNFTLLLNKLYSNIPFQECDLYSTTTDFYSKYSSGMYPSVPLNLFGTNYKNLFTDREVQGYFKTLKNKFNDLKHNTERNNYFEYLNRMQNSNTI
jgi:hypothetical protein